VGEINGRHSRDTHKINGLHKLLKYFSLFLEKNYFEVKIFIVKIVALDF